MPASRFLKIVQEIGQIPVCSFYLPVSTSRNLTVLQYHNHSATVWCSLWYLLPTTRATVTTKQIVSTVASREVETGKSKLQTGFGQFLPVYFRNLLAAIWGSFLRFIETGFKNWLAAFLGFFCDFSMMSMIFLWFFRIFLSFFYDFYLIL